MLLIAGSTLRVFAGQPVVASTTSILGDVVKQIAGDAVEQLVIMPPGLDPHHFEPSAKDMANLANASVIFINGLGLESFMDRQLNNLTRSIANVPLICPVSGNVSSNMQHEHNHDHDHDHDHETTDPHVWTDPMNVVQWVDVIAATLTNLLPDQSAAIEANATSYKAQLHELDAWIKEYVATLPADKRQLVTDHHMLHYFSSRYGFEQIGMIIPSYSTSAEPSARELAQLHQTIDHHKVHVIFIAFSSNPLFADGLARDTGVNVVSIYSGTLGAPGSGVESYIDYMKFNTRTIVDALQDEPTAP